MNTPGDKAVTEVILAEGRLIGMGNSLLSVNPAAALSFFEWAAERNPLSPNAHISLAAGYEAAGRADQAVAEARKTLDLLDKASGLSESRKKAIRETATALLERLRGIRKGANPSSL